ncbi:hypothetical protein DN006_18885 [Salmonella enterica subsp. enterica serovar Java]|nr:hypothetical protein [Salmonella enterica subsp. enterica serovar Java]
MMRYFHCYLHYSGADKNKTDNSKIIPLKTILNRHASQHTPTEKNCSDILVPYIQVTGNSDLNF